MPALRGPGGRFVSPSAISAQATGNEPVVEIESNARATAVRLDLITAALGRRLPVAMAESVEVIKHGIKENFETEGAHFAGRWQELTAKTIANKVAKGTSDEQMLVDVNHDLEEALTEHEQLITTFDVTEFSVGSSDWRTHFFQHGTEKMAARPVIGVSAADAEKVIRIFEFEVAKAILAGDKARV